MVSWQRVWWDIISPISIYLTPFTTKSSSSFSVWFAPKAFNPKFFENKLKHNSRGKDKQ